MINNENLFLKILKIFEKKDILKNLILVGSWVLPVYKEYFNNSPDIPILRTTDLDFIVYDYHKIKIHRDLLKILKELDFEIQYSVLGNFQKFIHPDLEIEFLTPQKGKGNR
ncbi:MAG: hypothetical protein APR63_09320 [Desulfuromonas sp. SDB]|nr:MAG: hypothetical protein APR63_09320 [Desulfuromonas sp. SDB]